MGVEKLDNECLRSRLVVAFGEFTSAILSPEVNNECLRSRLVVAFGEFTSAKLHNFPQISLSRKRKSVKTSLFSKIITIFAHSKLTRWIETRKYTV